MAVPWIPALELVALAAALGAPAEETSRPRPYTDQELHRLAILWGAECVLPDGTGLAFGGVEQASEEGPARTRIREGGEWKPISEELRKRNPLQRFCDQTRELRAGARSLSAGVRASWFDGVPVALSSAKEASRILEELDRAAEAFDAEPPPRALSPIAFDPKTGLFVLFGGDHLDYLMNDTWVFDPRSRAWHRRSPRAAPPPRANHRLTAGGDGTVVLSGGTTYTSSTDYMGGQYRDLEDGSWSYDVAADAWSGAGNAGPPDRRLYRDGPYLPGFFLEGPPPDAPGFERFLREMPANAWNLTRPPRIPRQNRDWGTAVLDPGRDLILYFCGGHCAHGGSDVLHFHLRTNRWELPFPVEFPLGQLYTNTAYPGGFNLNRRPWPTGHTYLSYALDPGTGKMVFTGHRLHSYLYDPDAADWTGRVAKPEGMTYDSCFYDLNTCAVSDGIVAWTKEGRFFHSTPSGGFTELKVDGKIPGSSVDFSCVVHDSRRDRLLLWRTDYGTDHDGQVYALDLKTLAARALSPGNRGAAAAAGRFGIDRACYHPGADLVVFATLLPARADGPRRTPAYDAAGNRWVSLALECEEPGEADRPAKLGPPRGDSPRTPRGHSSAIVFDPKRGLIWGVDASCRVYVLRLEAAGADVREM